MDCDILPMFAIHIPQLCLAHIRSFFGLQPDVCGWKQLFVLWSHYIFSFLVATPLPTISSISVVWTGDTSFTAFFRWRWQLFSHSFWRTFVVLGFLLEHVAIDTTICHFHRANQDKTTMFWLLLSSLGMIIIDPTIFWMKTLPSMNLPPSLPKFPPFYPLSMLVGFECFRPNPFILPKPIIILWADSP